MELNVGDRVRILNETGEGVVTRILDADRVVVRIDGFDFTYLKKNVVKIVIDEEMYNEKKLSPGIYRRISHVVRGKEKPEEKPLRVKGRKRKESKKWGAIKEIDLHIEELIDDHFALENREILNIQTSHFTKKLDAAIARGERKIIFIHGVGQGVLKRELTDILRVYYPTCVYYEASYQRYGYGALEIEIR